MFKPHIKDALRSPLWRPTG